MPLLGQFQSGLDILLLRGFVAANQQQYQFGAALRKVHPVAGAEVDLHFNDATGKHAVLPGVAMSEAKNPQVDAPLGLPIAQGLEPLGVLRGLLAGLAQV